MEEKSYYELEEVAQWTGLSLEMINYSIEEEWVVPYSREPFTLDDEDVARLFLISDLRETMGVNEEAIPIILGLIDQLHFIQGRLKRS